MQRVYGERRMYIYTPLNHELLPGITRAIAIEAFKQAGRLLLKLGLAKMSCWRQMKYG